MTYREQRTTPRPAFTLVELLVVILIVMLLAGVSIPVLAPALSGRRIRETSRSVTAYLNGARDTAMRNGRPVGVMFERFVDPETATTLQMSIVLRQVEVPPPYAGDYTNSRALVNATGVVGLGKFQADFTPLAQDLGVTGLVRVGDMIRLNNQGIYYLITGGTADSSDPRYLQPPTTTNPWTVVAQGNSPTYLATGALVPYQIYRQPVKSSNPPLVLPESVIFDLQYSGMTSLYSFVGASQSPTIMFSPNGTVDSVYGDAGLGALNKPRPTGPIYLLIGKRERLQNANDGATLEEYPNWRDLENLWITVFPQSGLITSSEVAEPDVSGLDLTNATDVATAIVRSRAIAMSGKSVGGR